jgi:hypothetical protein
MVKIKKKTKLEEKNEEKDGLYKDSFLDHLT